MTTDSDEADFADSWLFVGPCTCSHKPEEHGFGGCDVQIPNPAFQEPDYEKKYLYLAPTVCCPCEAGWEE